MSVVALALFAVLCQEAAPATDENRVDELLEHAVAVRSMDAADRDLTDLPPLIDASGNSDVVVLGENSHSDGPTSQAKCRMIRFLHERMGFDVLVWEAGLVDCEAMNHALRCTDVDLYDAKATFMRGGWA